MDTTMRPHYIKVSLFISLFVLHVLDAAVTVHMVETVASFEIESNPLIKLLMVASGTADSLWVAKLVVMLAVALTLTWISNTVLAWLNVLTAVVVLNNFYILFTV